MGNYPGDNYLGTNCPGSNFAGGHWMGVGGNYPGGNCTDGASFLEENCPRSIILGVIIQEVIIRGEIVLEPLNFHFFYYYSENHANISFKNY